jgi:hypothetical protein
VGERAVLLCWDGPRLPCPDPASPIMYIMSI